MMESMSSDLRSLVIGILSQIDTAIAEIQEWNKNIASANRNLPISHIFV